MQNTWNKGRLQSRDCRGGGLILYFQGPLKYKIRCGWEVLSTPWFKHFRFVHLNDVMIKGFHICNLVTYLPLGTERGIVSVYIFLVLLYIATSNFISTHFPLRIKSVSHGYIIWDVIFVLFNWYVLKIIIKNKYPIYMLITSIQYLLDIFLLV